ncbi:hypothetical protein [Nocardia mangyaensis]|uniref:hypothetical protein n=1 Tax=Nocardia mangyaensis TaxID=2213200 RepID=UPI002676F097|nr:hypothetical protein [Nocardia mangyaensis]MDO3649375.1 hypothetical protein [Nocardia mangyaensis]
MTGSGERGRVWVAGYCALLTLIIVGPLAGSGYLLLRDAVSTPRSYLTDSALGLGAAAPRAVPQDALLAFLSPVIDGGILVKAILIVALWSAGYGAAVLARRFVDAGTGAQLVAATLALWNPFVAERLLQGHWSLLTGYAALPWVALAAARIRSAATGVGHLAVPTTGTGPADSRSIRGTPAAHGVDSDGIGGPTPTGVLGAGETGSPGGARRTADATGRDRSADSSGHAASTDDRTESSGSTEQTASTIGHHGPRDGTGRAVGLGRAVGAWGALAACFAAAGLTPTGSLLAAVVGLALVGRRALLPALGLWVLTCAPWLTATALGSGAEPSDPAGVAAFAARAEPWLGTLGSLAGLGGIWNGEAVPASRTTPLALVGTLLLLGIVALGVRAVWAIGRNGRTLLVIAAVAIVLPALGATGWGLAAGEWLMVHVPGAGLLRDTQKYVALAMPAYALCAAAACRTVLTWWRRIAADGHAPSADIHQTRTGSAESQTDVTGAAASNRAFGTDEPGHAAAASEPGDTARAAEPGHAGFAPGSSAGGAGTIDAENDSAADRSTRTGISAVAALFIALLIFPLADLAWGIGGQMRPVHYPTGWAEVVEHIDGPGDVAVLPGGMFRRFPYSGTAPVLDPAPRILPNDVLQTGELRVRGYAVNGEGNRARTVEETLLRGGSPVQLADLGVGWILLERTTPGPLGTAETTLAATELVYQDTDLALYRIPDPTPRDIATPTQRRTSAAAHLLWAALLLTGLTLAALRPSTR